MIKKSVLLFTTALTLGSFWAGSSIAPELANANGTSNSYTIQSGDNLYRIALNHGVDLYDLAAYNGITVGSIIYPGQTLAIPGATVQATEQQELVRNTAYYGSGLTQEQYNVLCAVVQQEAGADNYAGLAAVMSVITNRVDSNWMGATNVYEVITTAYQFEAYDAGHYEKHLGNISDATIQAVNDGLAGVKSTSATSFRSTSYAVQNGYTGVNIDGNTFFIE